MSRASARSLPSLNALRTFEVAARHLNLSRAALELNVTPAAVSHQIRSLEAELGVTLLQRHKSGYALSAEGRTVLPLLQAAFGQFAEAAYLLRSQGRDSSVLSVNVCPTFASTWLVPRLGDFRARHGHIDVRVNATEQLADFGEVDLAIRLGGDAHEDLAVYRLFEGDLFPVCSPSLIEREGALRLPADVLDHPLLHVNWSWLYGRTRPPRSEDTLAWRNWLRAAGIDGVELTHGLRFSHISLALRAAAEGQGIALACELMIHDELASGRLVRLFDTVLPRWCAYYIVHPVETTRTPKVAAFREWILGSMASQRRSAATPVNGRRI